MYSTLAPARQRAHDLVDRLAPVQLSSFLNLFEPLSREQAQLFRAPICNQLPADEPPAFRLASVRRNITAAA